MSVERRSFRREGEERRREALIAAALELVAEGGPQAATVRAIAERAGVTAGLIRHYFLNKEDLTRAAYRSMMDRMTAENAAAITDLPEDQPLVRLATFVAASLRPPVMDPVAMGRWAGFMHLVLNDAAMREVHEATYLAYRNLLQSLIAALPRSVDADRLRRDAIACNAVIDGLWLEGSVLADRFTPGEIEAIGLASVGAILGVDLASHLAADAGVTP